MGLNSLRSFRRLLPAQDQFHGPVPVIAEAVPRLQSPDVGALLTVLPLAGPHEPFTAEEAVGAEQLAFFPPLLPTQDHVHGPLPLTDEVVPALQRLVVGVLLTATPLVEPH